MGLETSPDLYFYMPNHIFISNEDKNLHKWCTLNCSLME